MADFIAVTPGSSPWRPTAEAELVAEYEYYDVPLCGVVRQHGVDYLFQCLFGATEKVSFWMYMLVSDRERRRLEAAESPEAFDRLVWDAEIDRPVVMALALEEVGIVAHRAVAGHDKDAVLEAVTELANELGQLAKVAKQMVVSA